MPNSYVGDIQPSFEGGQDASTTPDKIQQTCFAEGINVSTARGSIGPRPAFLKKQLQFPTGGIEFRPAQIKKYPDIFYGGKFQALIPYQVGSQFYIIVVISGVIFLINQTNFKVEVLELNDGTRLDELQPRVNWSNAGRFLVLFDFPARPVIIEGKTVRRSRASNNEVPVSRLGVYNQNRLFIANGGTEFTGGDPSGSLSTPDAPITFDEIMPGGAFAAEIYQVGSDYNNSPITSMGFLQAADTGTGIGPLFVSVKNAMYTYNTQNPRSAWAAGQFGSLLVYKAGVVGARAGVNVNSDFFFLSQDGGVRSLSMARSDQHRWSRVPMSREVRNWLKSTSPDLLEYAALGYFKNTILITCNPYRVPVTRLNGEKVLDVAHGGFVALELANISKLGSSSNPTWAGLWTGVRPMDLCENDERCFIMSKDDFSQNNLYEMDVTSHVDRDGAKKRLIRSVIYTREYLCGDAFSNKELSAVDLTLNDVRGAFNLTIEYKPSHGSHFTDWVNFDHYAPNCIEGIPEDSAVNGLVGHSFRQLTFGAPDESNKLINPVTTNFYRIFRKIQLRFTITGEHWEMNEFRLRAVPKPQTDTGSVYSEPKFLPLELPKPCNRDWFVESF